MLEGVTVALGVTGSIAAVKTVELAHELRRQGAEVHALMTPAAEGIIHPWALKYATDNPVVTEITGSVEHVELCGNDGEADILLVAPATANTVGKMASAIDDTPVTTTATTAFGSDVPIVVVPAMHEPMYDHPGVLEAIDTLESWDVEFVDPRIEEGKAKIATEKTIVTAVARATTPQRLDGQTVVVTSGATTESIDPVRTLSNRASGRTGREVARACYARGAEVVLVHDGPDYPWATVEAVESAAEMLEAVLDHTDRADALVSVAAISDYTVETAGEKLRSGKDDLTLELEPTPKLIDSVREAHPTLTIVGFKAESESSESNLIDRAAEIQRRAGLAFVVGNRADVMGEAETSVTIVEGEETEQFAGSKRALGGVVADRLAAELD
jgi:phosphopantothenoylcysteine decarboxylase/phosphopantothenate--cysteine ligase